MTRDDADNILRILSWAKANGAARIRTHDVEVVFAGPAAAEPSPQLVPPAAPRDPRAWADMQLFGKPMGDT